MSWIGNALARLGRAFGARDHSHAVVEAAMSEVRSLRASYDLARTTDDNRKHWSPADSLSAEAANTNGVRQVLRNRARYEVANNSYVKGMVRTKANDTIGKGPRLQMIGGASRKNSTIESDFADWAKEIKLAKKLRKMVRAKLETGEVIAVVFNNPRLRSVIKLDVMLVEADRLHDPMHEYAADPLWCDGIQYDGFENPISYRVLKYHPGGTTHWRGNPLDFEDYAAEYVYHYWEDERPGQRRGVPEFTPSIQTGGELRRYDRAVLRTAEVHARNSMVLETDIADSIDGNDQKPATMETVELPESGAVVLPNKFKLNGFQPQQPHDKHVDFVDVKLRETARCINMPFTIAALDSSKSNLSARYLDSQIYAAAIKVERDDLECEFLDWIFLRHWAPEYWLVQPNMPRGEDRYPHTWYWPSLSQHADPSKIANAAKTRQESGLSCIPDEIAEEGGDYEELFEKEARALDITVQEYKALLRLKRFGTVNKDGTPMVVASDPESSNRPWATKGPQANGPQANGNGRSPAANGNGRMSN